MWYPVISTIKPDEVDTSSSTKYVYIRRNITETTDDDDNIIYEYEEYQLPKEIYDVVKVQDETISRVNDIEETITEIIGGGLI
jgi:hypothetical protein